MKTDRHGGGGLHGYHVTIAKITQESIFIEGYDRDECAVKAQRAIAANDQGDADRYEVVNIVERQYPGS